MFPNWETSLAPRHTLHGKPLVVYAGGLQKWQQVGKMLDTVGKTFRSVSYRFYCPDPAVLRAMLPKKILTSLLVDHKDGYELREAYSQCHYGLTLREASIVNQVACPTKLVEYLGMGIVPILDSEKIGDFKKMGMQFVTLQALLRGHLPREAQRAAMARHNALIYERLRQIYRQGARELRTALSMDCL
jgi:hypothetical protein